MKNIISLWVLGVLIFLSGCSATSGLGGTVRNAVDTPDKFVAPEGITLDGNSCKSPMVDPRDGTQIRMVLAHAGQGIYEVPAKKYGVNKGEYLKLDCASGEVLGITSRN